MNEIENNAKLFAKMAKVMGHLKRLKKSGHNVHFNYDFATDADVSDTIRELLAEQNIGIFASMPGYDKMEAGTTSKGVPQYNTIVHMEITLACGDSGATFTTQWHGEAITTDDKGINKAATSAVKYWLMKTFLLSTGDITDDPDSGSGQVGTRTPRNPAPQAQAEPPATPKGKTPAAAPQNAQNDDSGVIPYIAPGDKQWWPMFWQYVTPLYDHPKHADASVKKMVAAGTVNAKTQTVAEAVKVVEQHVNLGADA